ncbi:hypothetical protein Mmc1_1230 [Magnetococcus marinus MC-1]|uniref:Uncharacterized protein n=1 Tax=Magnetococcus marinus (strain ATCC BAA-1437 / JCM 17883 / MC-1) TaxID=156889 RepID=A0L6Z8_MAGMM|nr:hypothetical protein [Magnetococcus marinus]ABK43741.1 hypothetical protein Mmc1_1230 [Magnetococcus marinus MC-1]
MSIENRSTTLTSNDEQSFYNAYYKLECVDPASDQLDQAPGIDFWPDDISACVMNITPSLAHQWLERNIKNRSLKRRHIQELVSVLENGHWRLNGESICFSRHGELLDGQHRLHAIAKSGVAAAAIVVFGVDNEVMRTYDQGSKRTTADHLNINGEKNYVSLGATLRLLFMWKTHQFHKEGPKFTPDQETLENLLTQHPSVRDSVPIAKKSGRFINVTNGAALHFLFRQTKIVMNGDRSLAADHFFEKLASGENITKQDPVYRLREALLLNQTSKKLNSVQTRAMTIKAWNLFSQNRRRGRIHWDPTEEPFPKIHGLAEEAE